VDEELSANKDRIAPMIELFKAVNAPCIVYGEVGRSVQGKREVPLAQKPKLSDDEMKTYARKVTAFGEWCAEEGIAAFLSSSPWRRWWRPSRNWMRSCALRARVFRCCSTRGTWPLRAGMCCAPSTGITKRINHVHVKDIRRDVVDGLDRSRQSFLDAVALGAFTVPGDGSLDFGAIVQRFADHGYEGWFVVEAEQDPVKNSPLKMAQVGHAELMRVVNAAGYAVEDAGFSERLSLLNRLC
jgi:inosose dehydratase